MNDTNKQVILLKYGEVVLKGLNRKHFERMLEKDAERRVEKCGNYAITSAQSTMYITPLDGDAAANIEATAAACAKIFGVVTVSIAEEFPKDTDAILAGIGSYVKRVRGNAKTFKVTGKRSDKHFPLTSPELAALCGAKILEANPSLRVDVNHPDLDVRVEIRDYAAYIHAGFIPGAGGMPAGSAGKAVLLLSGGIDSPVAGYMCAKRGVSIEALHFDSFPYTSERARQKVIDLACAMQDTCGRIHMHVISLTEIQETIKATCREDYFTLLLRRFMMRLAERTAKSLGAGSLITGESLGQVASQTMPALAVTGNAVSTLPVLRPLIALDKEEIIQTARRIGTFDISIQPFEDCCTVFTPRHPVTSPILEKVLKEEAKLDVEGLTSRAFEKIESVVLSGR
ncbi:MAG: tRNA uracil 4-sulfurtransferase ThiI [Eubacteriales bacterium]